MNDYVFLMSLCGIFGIAVIFAKVYGELLEKHMPWEDEQ